MNIVEYFNILSFEMMERKKREEKFQRALANCKNSILPYHTALLEEILTRL